MSDTVDSSPTSLDQHRGGASAGAQEFLLRRHLGFWSLTAIGFSNIVGSGWLFAAMYSAKIAGPASLLSWIGAGLLCALVAMVMVELGVTRPEDGGTVRWPLYASGRLVGSLVGWSTLLSVGGTAAEISAILGYGAHYLPWLYSGDRLTVPGVAVGMLFAALLTSVNWFAVKVFARFNNLITVVKVAVPIVTVILLLISGFHSGRMTSHGGFAPYGYTACFTALATGGIVYSVNGFQAAVDFSGEAKDPRRTIPAAVIAAIVLAVGLYAALQLTFLFTVPDSFLGHGWSGVNFTSPFGQLALVMNLQWVSMLLYADAVLSPGASANVGVGLNARHTYALGKSGILPRFFMAVHAKSGIPRRALVLNLGIIVLFLLPFGGWQGIVAVMGDMYLITYLTSAVAAAIFRRTDNNMVPAWSRGMPWIAPASFVAAGEFVYWSGWDQLRLVIPLILIGVAVFAIMSRGRSLRAELLKGSWLVTYLVALLILSRLGSFGGTSALPAPLDSCLVAALSLAIFRWALRSGIAHVRTAPADECGIC
ncbi:APC family permease [Leekyejoonella antrihumi]|uniref:APC family permease n=2 Tax=Leekyejoonella antrihumi TaxID=1660198 RepID=A0A563E981_9MICO|nr:APC family permease [Leekyejoonella antrihumi]